MSTKDGGMNANARIEIGDTVSVTFNGAQSTLARKAEVLALPCATGDSWIFKDSESGFVHYVSEGCTVSKSLTP